VWAVYDQRRADYLPVMMQMLDQYRDDAYLLNRVVGCIGRTGGQGEIERAMAGAHRLLEAEVRQPE
jgi:hypothetical protein